MDANTLINSLIASLREAVAWQESTARYNPQWVADARLALNAAAHYQEPLEPFDLNSPNATPPPEPPTVPWADVQVATEKAFHLWWDNEGSGMPPQPNEETVVHVERISKLAWSNGAYVAYARWGR